MKYLKYGLVVALALIALVQWKSSSDRKTAPNAAFDQYQYVLMETFLERSGVPAAFKKKHATAFYEAVFAYWCFQQKGILGLSDKQMREFGLADTFLLYPWLSEEDRLHPMRKIETMEEGPVFEIYYNPLHLSDSEAKSLQEAFQKWLESLEPLRAEHMKRMAEIDAMP